MQGSIENRHYLHSLMPSAHNSYLKQSYVKSPKHLISSVRQIRQPSTVCQQQKWVTQTVVINTYQEQLELLGAMGWRQCTSMPVRKIRYYHLENSLGNYDNSLNGFPKTYKVQVEPILYNLSFFKGISLSSALYIISECILGYQALSYKSNNLKHTEKMISPIEAKHCGVNKKGECRVGMTLWDSSKTETPKFQAKKCKQIILQVISMVQKITSPFENSQIRTLKANIQKVPQITYNLAQALIREFANQRKMLIPKTLENQLMKISEMWGQNLMNFSNMAGSSMLRSHEQPVNRNFLKSHENHHYGKSPINRTRTDVKPNFNSAKVNWNYLNHVQNEASQRTYQNYASSQNIHSPQYSRMASPIMLSSVKKIPNSYEYYSSRLNPNQNSASNIHQSKIHQSFINQTSIMKYSDSEPQVKEFMVQEEKDKNLKDSKKLTIIPQYSFISQLSQSSSEQVNSQGYKSSKTTQCFSSNMASTKNNEMHLSVPKNIKNLVNRSNQSVWDNNYGLKQSHHLENPSSTPSPALEKLGLGKNTESLLFDRPKSTIQESVVIGNNYNFGGLFPQIKINTEAIPQQFTSKQNIYGSQSFNEKITSSVFLGAAGENNISQKLQQNGWTNSIKLLNDKENDDLKQSVYCGDQHVVEVDNIVKLSKLGKLGRMIQKSMIPIQEQFEPEESFRF